MSNNVILVNEEINVVEIQYEGVSAAHLADLEVRVTDLENEFVDNNGNIIGRLDQLDEDVASQATLNAAQTAAITEEISLRESADFSITTQTAEDINALSLATGAAIALEANTRAQAILDEATARGAAIASSEAIIYGDMAILATTVDGIATELGAAQASIITVSDALVTETAARVAQYTALQVDFGDTNAAVLEESVARADADSALASSITVVEAIATSKNKTFRATSAPTAEGVGDLWYDTDDNNKIYRWDGSSWVNIQDGNIPINAAAIVTEATARANADSALATSITTVSAVAASKNATFRQTSAPTALGTGDLWYDSDDDNKLYRWSGSAWVATDDGRIATNAAAITSEATARATADSAMATDITTVTATANSKIKTFYQTSAPTASAAGDLWFDTDDNNKVYRWSGSSWVASDDARIAANAASITTEASARATADGVIEAKYSVKVDVNGHVSGFGLISTANNATPFSEFVVDADSFKVYNGSSDVAPFSVTGGEVFLDNLIVRSTIRQGQTAYDTGTGFWLGDVSGTPKFSLGNSAGNKMTWDGSTLAISGSINIANTATTFTPTWTGFSTPPSGDISYIDMGAFVILWVPSSLTGTSNTTACTITNIPTAIRPASGARFVPCMIVDNNGVMTGSASLSGATLTLSVMNTTVGSLVIPNASGFTASSQKGLAAGFMMIYSK